MKTPLLESFLNKLEGLQLYSKETSTQLFSCESPKIFRNSFFYGTTTVATSK